MMIREPLIWSMQNVFIFRLYEWSSGGVYNAKPAGETPLTPYGFCRSQT